MKLCVALCVCVVCMCCAYVLCVCVACCVCVLHVVCVCVAFVCVLCKCNTDCPRTRWQIGSCALVPPGVSCDRQGPWTRLL